MKKSKEKALRGLFFDAEIYGKNSGKPQYLCGFPVFFSFEDVEEKRRENWVCPFRDRGIATKTEGRDIRYVEAFKVSEYGEPKMFGEYKIKLKMKACSLQCAERT